MRVVSEKIELINKDATASASCCRCDVLLFMITDPSSQLYKFNWGHMLVMGGLLVTRLVKSSHWVTTNHHRKRQICLSLLWLDVLLLCCCYSCNILYVLLHCCWTLSLGFTLHLAFGLLFCWTSSESLAMCSFVSSLCFLLSLLACDERLLILFRLC